MNDGTILFSGRFDRPHIGHIDTITSLGQQFRNVLVVVLDYKEQEYPVQYRADKLKAILERCKGNYEVVINKTHFARITKEEADGYDFDYYGAGNFETLKHMENLGYKIIYINRSDDTAATDERKYNKIRSIMNE